MTDDTLPGEYHPTRRPADELKRQARKIRQGSRSAIQTGAAREASPLAKILYLALIVVVMGTVSYLLMSQGARRTLLTTACDTWQGLRPSQEAFLRLPPPASHSTVIGVQAVRPAGPASGPAPSEGEAQGIFYTLSEPAVNVPDQDRDGRAAVVAKTPGSTGAYTLLTEKSDLAKRLTSGELEGYRFKEWKPLKDDAPRYYISLIALDAEGKEAAFTFLVDVEAETTQPLSQLARDLSR